MWPEVLTRLREIKRTPWSLISQESAVADVSDGVLTLAFRQPTLRDTFARREDFQAFLKQAIKEVLFIDLRIEAIVDPSADPSAARAGEGASAAAPARSSASAPGQAVQDTRSGDWGTGTTTGEPGANAGQDAQQLSRSAATPDASAPSEPASRPHNDSQAPPPSAGQPQQSSQPQGNGQPQSGSQGQAAGQVGRAAAAKAAIQQRNSRPSGPAQPQGSPDGEDTSADHGADLDDEDLDMSGESEQELLARTLGATVISESENN